MSELQTNEELLTAEDNTPFIINRTRTITNDEGDDPLSPTPPDSQIKQLETSSGVLPTDQSDTDKMGDELDKEVSEVKEEEKQPEVKLSNPEFFDSLDTTFQEKLGVKFDDVIAAMVDLIQWRTDILSLGLQNTQQGASGQPPAVPQQPVSVPEFQRSQGRTAPVGQNRYRYTQSQIDKMTLAEYEKLSQDITNAYMLGEVYADY